MTNNFTMNDIVKILNSLQLYTIESGQHFQLGHTVVKSKDGDFVYSDDLASAFGLSVEYDNGHLKFVNRKKP